MKREAGGKPHDGSQPPATLFQGYLGWVGGSGTRRADKWKPVSGNQEATVRAERPPCARAV